MSSPTFPLRNIMFVWIRLGETGTFFRHQNRLGVKICYLGTFNEGTFYKKKEFKIGRPSSGGGSNLHFLPIFGNFWIFKIMLKIQLQKKPLIMEFCYKTISIFFKDFPNSKIFGILGKDSLTFHLEILVFDQKSCYTNVVWNSIFSII